MYLLNFFDSTFHWQLTLIPTVEYEHFLWIVLFLGEKK